VTVGLAGLLVLLLLGVAVFAFFTGTLTSFCVALAAGALTLAILLGVRRSALPRGFVATFLLVFLLVFGAADFITAIMPESFVSTARVKLTLNPAEAAQKPASRSGSGNYDPYLIQTEFEVMQSAEILGPVIKALDLDQEWSKRYGRGEPLKPAETMALLKSRMNLHPVRNASVVTIGVYAEEPDEAARIANEIAHVYKNHNDSGPLRVEIIDRAVPGLHPVRPNKPLNLAIGALLGLVLGTAAGAARIALRARKKRH